MRRGCGSAGGGGGLGHEKRVGPMVTPKQCTHCCPHPFHPLSDPCQPQGAGHPEGPAARGAAEQLCGRQVGTYEPASPRGQHPPPTASSCPALHGMPVPLAPALVRDGLHSPHPQRAPSPG